MSFLDEDSKGYIERRLQAGASDNRIAAELANPRLVPEEEAGLPRPVRISPSEVAGMRRDLGIAAAAPVAMKTAAVISVPRKKAKAAAAAFNDASGAAAAGGRKKTRPALPVFEPAMVEERDLRRDRIYVIHRQGAFRCTGVDDIPIAGQTARIAKFRHLHTDAAIGVSVGKLKERGVRRLAEKGLMEKLIRRVKAGAGEIHIPKKPVPMLKFFKALETDMDLARAAAIARTCYANPGNGTGIAYAHGIASALASEYAAIFRMTFEQARVVVEDALARPTLASLSRSAPAENTPKKDHH